MVRQISKIALSLVMLFVFAGYAFAYVGPGAGLTAIGSLLAIVGVVFLAILGFLWYPLKRMFSGKTKAAKEEKSQQTSE